MNIKILITLIITLMSVTSFAGNDGHGGGGISRNGRYMSFYSAGLYVKPQNNLAPMGGDIPSLGTLVDYMMSLNELDLETKSKVLDAIIPTINRQYLVASPNELTPEVYARLMEEFKRMTGVDTKNLRLFALTDTTQKITYILPGFEKLALADQVAILFHEGYWILHPDATYNEVVSAEMAFQATYTNPNDKSVMYDFLVKLGASSKKIAIALAKWDLEQGNLNGLVEKNDEIPLRKIYGEEFFKCGSTYKSTDDSNEVCNVYLEKNLYDLLRRYPKSMVLRKIAESYAKKGGDVFVNFKGHNRGGNSGGRFIGDDEVFSSSYYRNYGRWYTENSKVYERDALKLMNCPIHLTETNINDCKTEIYYLNGHFELNF